VTLETLHAAGQNFPNHLKIKAEAAPPCLAWGAASALIFS
jgi:hypothetical protein